MDITPHLSKTSEAFQLYIQRGLAKAVARRSSPLGAPPPVVDSAAALGPLAARPSGAEAYAERLARVKSGVAAAAEGSLSAAGNLSGGAAAVGTGSRQNLDALRERMRSIAARAGSGNQQSAVAQPPPPSPPPAAQPSPPLPSPLTMPPLPSPDESAACEPPPEPPTSQVTLSDLQARMARLRAISEEDT